MITLACTFLFVGFKTNLLQDSAIILGVIVATPRLVQIFQYANDLFSSAAQYYYYKVRIEQLRAFVTEQEHEAASHKKTSIFAEKSFYNV